MSDPSIPLKFKLGWLALFLAGMIKPAWRVPLVVVLVPLSPWVPFEIRGVPYGLVHFVVLSQALPWLLRPGAAMRPWRGPAAWSWLLLVGVALASLVVQYAAYATVFDSSAAFLRDVGSHFEGYPGGRPGPSIENMFAAAMAIATGCLVFGLVRTAPVSRARILECFGGVAVAVSLVGFWQAWTGSGLRLEWRINDPFITRINATFSDPNALAAFLAVATPLVLALAGRASGRARLSWAVGAGLVFTALVMTAGRIAAVAALVGVCVLGALVIRAGVDRLDPSPLLRRAFRRAAVTIAVLIVLVVAGLTLAGTMLDARHYGQHTYLDTWLYTFNLRRPAESAKGRLAIWQAALRMIEDRPAFGLGIGRIYRLFGYYARGLTDVPDGMAFSAHNTFLNVGAELGLVGLAAWLAVLAASFREALARLRPERQSESSESRWIDAGLTGALVALTVTMTTGDRAILYEDLVMLGVLTGLLASTGVHVAASIPRREVVLRYAAIGFGLALVLSLPARMLAERRTVPLDHVTSGLHPMELTRQGTKFRWTTGRALFYLPPSATTLKLRLRSIAPFPQTAQVLIRGAMVLETRITDAHWIEIRPVLPRTRDNGYQRVEVRVSPTWTPPGDGRELGVMLDWDFR